MNNIIVSACFLLFFLCMNLSSAASADESFGDVTLLMTIPTLSDNKLDDLLSFGYYRKSCPDFEAIVSRKVKDWINKDFTLGASLLKLHFHDCAVRVPIIYSTHKLFSP